MDGDFFGTRFADRRIARFGCTARIGRYRGNADIEGLIKDLAFIRALARSFTRRTPRGVRQHRFDGGPFVTAEFLQMISRLRFPRLNHVRGCTLTHVRSNGYCGRPNTPDRAASPLPRERLRSLALKRHSGGNARSEPTLKLPGFGRSSAIFASSVLSCNVRQFES
jgi:hypothetical protein